MSPFAGRSVLVTGAGGSIGSQVCEAAAKAGARRLTLVSLTEGGLYVTDKFLRRTYPEVELVPVVGSAGNRAIMGPVLDGVDIVIHAAAHKHVPLCETNPVEAIGNNVFGTYNLAHECIVAGVDQFCLVSSDKAVKPASIMGATKRLAELLIGSMIAGIAGCRFFTVRFGNVMDSAGSVLPLWREQIAQGAPITITDERCERFFMTVQQAVRLITQVVGLHPPRGTFVFDMGAPRRLVDLAREVIAESGQDVPIKVIGLRPGEKLTEELHHGGTLVPTSVEGVYAVEDGVAVPDAAKVMALKHACERGSREKAVALLWDLVH